MEKSMDDGISRRKFLLGSALLGASFSLIQKSYAFDKNTLKIAFSNQNPPFSFIKNGAAKGVLPNLLNHILSYKMGLDVKFFALPWKRAQREVLLGIYDGFCTFPSVARQEYMQFSNLPLASQDMSYIFYSPKNPKSDLLKQATQLNELKDLLMLGTIGADWERQNIPDTMRKTEVPNLKIAHRMLNGGRGDFFIDSLESINYYERDIDPRDRLSHIKLNSIPNNKVHYHFGLRKSLKNVDKLMFEFEKMHKAVENTNEYIHLQDTPYEYF